MGQRDLSGFLGPKPICSQQAHSPHLKKSRPIVNSNGQKPTRISPGSNSCHHGRSILSGQAWSNTIHRRQDEAITHCHLIIRDGPNLLSTSSPALSAPIFLKEKNSLRSSSSVTKAESFSEMGYMDYKGGILRRLKSKLREDFYPSDCKLDGFQA